MVDAVMGFVTLNYQRTGVLGTGKGLKNNHNWERKCQ